MVAKIPKSLTFEILSLFLSKFLSYFVHIFDLKISMKPFLFFAICSFTLTNTFAQTDSSGKRTHYFAEAGTFISTSSKMPFWLRTNQYGIVPNKAPIVTFRGGVYHDYEKLKPKHFERGGKAI